VLVLRKEDTLDEVATLGESFRPALGVAGEEVADDKASPEELLFLPTPPGSLTFLVESAFFLAAAVGTSFSREALPEGRRTIRPFFSELAAGAGDEGGC